MQGDSINHQNLQQFIYNLAVCNNYDKMFSIMTPPHTHTHTQIIAFVIIPFAAIQNLKRFNMW